MQNIRILLFRKSFHSCLSVQVHMLNKYGVNSTICVDYTHGTNVYDIQLTTVMVIDDHGEGFPVAFCYSNHMHTEAMEVFF